MTNWDSTRLKRASGEKFWKSPKIRIFNLFFERTRWYNLYFSSYNPPSPHFNVVLMRMCESSTGATSRTCIWCTQCWNMTHLTCFHSQKAPLNIEKGVGGFKTRWLGFNIQFHKNVITKRSGTANTTTARTPNSQYLLTYKTQHTCTQLYFYLPL